MSVYLLTNHPQKYTISKIYTFWKTTLEPTWGPTQFKILLETSFGQPQELSDTNSQYFGQNLELNIHKNIHFLPKYTLSVTKYTLSTFSKIWDFF